MADMDLRPTLFIAIGGTGKETLLRIRRKILNNAWGAPGKDKVFIQSLTEFSVAQFLQIDLDTGAVIDEGKAQNTDSQFEAIKFKPSEKIVEPFNMFDYCESANTLANFPNIKEWFPISPEKLKDLNIDPKTGAGQIRAISKLYFFDKYKQIKEGIREKLIILKSDLNYETDIAPLGIKVEPGNKIRVVVVCSVAGGTGSGSFLDMGWLTRLIASSEGNEVEVDLVLFLPTGYSGKNKERTEANAYGALMELEAGMRGDNSFVGKWDRYDSNPKLAARPYENVYLIDSGNIAKRYTKDIKDIYSMVADTLFEDFTSSDFAAKKRSIASNKQQKKIGTYSPPVPEDKFGQMRLSYAKSYASFGQAVLETHLDLRRELRGRVCAQDMLKVFFNLGLNDENNNQSIDEKRDNFLGDVIGVKNSTFNRIPSFKASSVKLKKTTGSFDCYTIVDKLLEDDNVILTAGIDIKVKTRFEDIKNKHERDQWAEIVRKTFKEFESDAIADENARADNAEDRIRKIRKNYYDKVTKKIKTILYENLDAREHGGIQFVISLVKQIKSKIELQGTGIIYNLNLNTARYIEIKELLKSSEFEQLLINLDQVKGKSFFSDNQKNAVDIMEQLKDEVANVINFHLRAIAAKESVIFLEDLSTWLGNTNGFDSVGKETWDGLIGEFLKGRESIYKMISQLETEVGNLNLELDKEHATLISIPLTEKAYVDEINTKQLNEWAIEAFKGFGGSDKIFKLLSTDEGSKEILYKIRRIAETNLLSNSESNNTFVDPLVTELRKLDNKKRVEYFKKLLECSMPWIDANIGQIRDITPDNFTFIIGVSNINLFQEFYNEIQSVKNNLSGSLALISTGVPGRMVSYVQLTGFPLTMLLGLQNWKTSYKIETERIAVHTHVDGTQFNHPLAFDANEIIRLADEFKYYLLAIMMSLLIRDDKNAIPPGLYYFKKGLSNLQPVGNERYIRQNGLSLHHRSQIISDVNSIIDNASSYELLAYTSLVEYYEKTVYQHKQEQDENGVGHEVKGFASAVAENLKNELVEKVMNKGIARDQIESLINCLNSEVNLDQWTSKIENSNKDAYKWEVATSAADKPLLKRFIKLKGQDLDSKIKSLCGLNSSDSTTTNIKNEDSNSKVVTSGQEILNQIIGLAKLKDDGILSQNEFDNAKNDLLKKLTS